ncbi:f-box protein [Nicotiana attenuata]|uniref:F-box protein n=1 Tax=Nicotiana attenuata TaxID=49451 RepID=A0A314L5J5_NICAT|nr:f-box protein [Nicotiana attenuata]
MLTNKGKKRSTKTKKNSSKKVVSFASVEGNNDLLTTILLLLSPKPLFRCKLVCKRWQSLISDPKFASFWRLKTPSLGGLFVNRFWRKDNTSFKYFYISFTDNGLIHSLKGLQNPYGEGVVILNSCGGLLLCRTMKKERTINPICKYYVSNPTTNQFIALPEITYYILTQHRYGDAADFLHMTLAFDYSVSSHFKVIHVCSDRRPRAENFEIGIYSSETNLWKHLTCQISNSAVSRVDFNNGVFVNRAIFWPAYKSETSIYFDLDTESLHPYPMPSKRREAMYFGSLKDRLYYIRSKKGSRLDVFELEKDYSSWCCKYKIYEFPEMNFSQINFLTLISGDENRYLVICTQPAGMVLSINLDDSSYTNLCKLLLRPSDIKELSETCGSAVHYLSENPFWIGSRLDI